MHCSKDVLKIQHDLVASIEHRSHQLLIEIPEPWNRVYGLSENFPPKLLNTLQFFAKTFSNTSTSIFAPDETYSDKRGSRVIYLRHNSETLTYEKQEFLIPKEDLAENLFALFNGNSIAKYAIESKYTRDIFVCTHANRDQCCGVFGREIYEKLRADAEIQNANIRIFRSSHIGGHRYAPTFLESPTLNCWGQVNYETARKITLRQGDAKSVIHHYRGSASLTSPFFQVAERELLAKYGWEWFEFSEKSFVGDSHVIVSFRNRQEEFRISKSDPVTLKANCDEDKLSSFPQYKVL